MLTYIVPHGIAYSHHLNEGVPLSIGCKVIDKDDKSLQGLEVLSIGENLAKVKKNNNHEEKMIPIRKLLKAQFQSYKAPLFVDTCVVNAKDFTQKKLKFFYKNLITPNLFGDLKMPSHAVIIIDEEGSKWELFKEESLQNYEDRIITTDLVELHNRNLICSCSDKATCHGKVLIKLFTQMQSCGEQEQPRKKKATFFDDLDLESEEEEKVERKPRKKKATFFDEEEKVERKPGKKKATFFDDLDLESEEEEEKVERKPGKKKAAFAAEEERKKKATFFDDLDLEDCS